MRGQWGPCGGSADGAITVRGARGGGSAMLEITLKKSQFYVILWVSYGVCGEAWGRSV